MLNPAERIAHKHFAKATAWVLDIVLATALVILVLFGIPRIETALEEQPVGKDFVDSLKNSQILQAVESISIITALVLYIQRGHRDEKERTHYMAWMAIDQAEGRETSYARFNALQTLNKDRVSLRGLDAVDADLVGIDLNEADLMECTFTRAKLKGANLQKAMLEFADLRDADLQQAILREAGFLDANLARANLGGADLRGADFRSADLQEVNFLYCNLQGADFRKAKNLQPDQIRCAQNWEFAKYDEEFRRKLA